MVRAFRRRHAGGKAVDFDDGAVGGGRPRVTQIAPF